MPIVVSAEERKRTGGKIARWRRQHNVTQAEFAGLVGVTRNTVARWERGELFPYRHSSEVYEVIEGEAYAEVSDLHHRRRSVPGRRSQMSRDEATRALQMLMFEPLRGAADGAR